MSDIQGTFGVTVWPVYVGALDSWGQEPRNGYQRGQIRWQADADDEICGHARIIVPAGDYTHLAYYHHPTTALMIGHQQLSHPLTLSVDGYIDVQRITKADFTQLPATNGYRLPV